MLVSEEGPGSAMQSQPHRSLHKTEPINSSPWVGEGHGHFLSTLNFKVLLGSLVRQALPAAEYPELSSRIH